MLGRVRVTRTGKVRDDVLAFKPNVTATQHSANWPSIVLEKLLFLASLADPQAAKVPAVLMNLATQGTELIRYCRIESNDF